MLLIEKKYQGGHQSFVEMTKIARPAWQKIYIFAVIFLLTSTGETQPVDFNLRSVLEACTSFTLDVRRMVSVTREGPCVPSLSSSSRKNPVVSVFPESDRTE